MTTATQTTSTSDQEFTAIVLRVCYAEFMLGNISLAEYEEVAASYGQPLVFACEQVA